MDDLLGFLWQSHSGHVRSTLLGLTHDYDLVEDLQQETYLRALHGISGFRGGDPRAWLCAIARNVFYSHVRRMAVRSEVVSELEPAVADSSSVGSNAHLDDIYLRKLLLSIPDDLRVAFILKHKAGLSYPEIASHLGCAAITARVRVNKALAMIRSLAVDLCPPCGPVCDGMSTDRIIDYLNDILPDATAQAVEEHLETCDQCHARTDAIRMLVNTLETLTSSPRMMHVVDLDPQGVPFVCVVTVEPNRAAQPREAISFDSNWGEKPRTLSVPGSRLAFDTTQSPNSPARLQYMARLPHWLKQGQRIRHWTSYGSVPRKSARRLSDDVYRLVWDQLPSEVERFGYIQTLRLPPRARVLSTDPAPVEVIDGPGATLIWQASLAPAERFRLAVDYRLTT